MSRKPICANCGIEIRWRPTIVDGVAYCCLGCSRGGPCECDYSRLPGTDDHTAIVSFTTVAVQVSFLPMSLLPVGKASK